jgi:hypothetical protein
MEHTFSLVTHVVYFGAGLTLMMAVRPAPK